MAVATYNYFLMSACPWEVGYWAKECLVVFHLLRHRQVEGWVVVVGVGLGGAEKERADAGEFLGAGRFAIDRPLRKQKTFLQGGSVKARLGYFSERCALVITLQLLF